MFALVVGALVPVVGPLVVGVVAEVVAGVDGVERLVDVVGAWVDVECDVDCGVDVDGWLSAVAVCELVSGGAECPLLLVDVDLPFLVLRASATAPPRRSAARTASVAHRPVRLRDRVGGRSGARGAGAAVRGAGAGGRGSAGTAAARGVGPVSVGGGGGGGAIASVVAASSSGPGLAIACRSRSRTSAAVCGRSFGSFASICMTTSFSASGIAGLRSRAGFGSTRTCWCMTAAATSATNGGFPVSIS